MNRRALFAAFALAALSFTRLAAQPLPSVSAQDVWARATPPHGGSGAVYLTLRSSTDDRLLAVATPAAAQAEPHEMKMVNNIMQMRPLAEGLALPAGQDVTLRPGGYHIMLEGLKAPLTEGDTVALHLTFQKAPPLDVQAKVLSIGASGPASSGGHDGMATLKGMPGMSTGK